MGGAFSRSKGRRNEQQLVLYLAKLFYKAERILRQYQFSGQPDVKATKDFTSGEQTFTFEMKARRASFKAIYDLYYKNRDDGVLTFCVGVNGTAVAISTDFEKLHTARHMYFANALEADKKDLKVYLRIAKMAEIKQGADFLVLKDNNKPMLFMRFW